MPHNLLSAPFTFPSQSRSLSPAERLAEMCRVIKTRWNCTHSTTYVEQDNCPDALPSGGHCEGPGLIETHRDVDMECRNCILGSCNKFSYGVPSPLPLEQHTAQRQLRRAATTEATHTVQRQPNVMEDDFPASSRPTLSPPGPPYLAHRVSRDQQRASSTSSRPGPLDSHDRHGERSRAATQVSVKARSVFPPRDITPRAQLSVSRQPRSSRPGCSSSARNVVSSLARPSSEETSDSTDPGSQITKKPSLDAIDAGSKSDEKRKGNEDWTDNEITEPDFHRSRIAKARRKEGDSDVAGSRSKGY